MNLTTLPRHSLVYDMKLSIIIPCYNESDNISKLNNELLPVVKDIAIHGWPNVVESPISVEMIFVDDGSGDETFVKLRECFANYSGPGVVFKFLRHETNLGLGAAIRTGFSNAEGDIILTADSDGTYKFSDIPVLLSLLVPDVDIVTASPYHPLGRVVGVPKYRLLFSRGASLIYRVLVNWHIYTYTCLFRAYRSSVIAAVSFRSNGFLAGTELLVKALLDGYTAIEFPAELRRRMYGVSKAKMMATTLAHLRFQVWVLYYRIRKLLLLLNRSST